MLSAPIAALRHAATTVRYANALVNYRDIGAIGDAYFTIENALRAASYFAFIPFYRRRASADFGDSKWVIPIRRNMLKRMFCALSSMADDKKII